MKKTLFLIIALLSFAYPQSVLNETFSDFSNFDTSGCVGLYIFSNDYHRRNSTSMVTDLSSQGNNITASGWSTNYKDEHQLGSPLYQGDSILVNVTGATKDFQIADVSDSDFEPGTDNFTIVFIASQYKDLTLGTGQVSGVCANGFGNVGSNAWWVIYRGGTNYNGFYSYAGGASDWYTEPEGFSNIDLRSTFSDSNYHKIAVRFDQTNDSLNQYYDNYLQFATDPVNFVGAINGTTYPQYIWRSYYTYLSGSLAAIGFYDKALSKKEIREWGFLANGWHSKNGGVTRDLINNPWVQGLMADTLFLSIDTTGIVSGHLDAWGANGGESLYIFNKAGDSQTITNLSILSQRFNIYSITFAASDSIYFYSPGTVYIDNIYLEMGESSPNVFSNNFTGFPEYPDFINDEVIQ